MAMMKPGKKMDKKRRDPKPPAKKTTPPPVGRRKLQPIKATVPGKPSKPGGGSYKRQPRNGR
jgi:hypothetical protein